MPYDVNGFVVGTDLDAGEVVDLALSAEAAVLWWYDPAAQRLRWMPGLAEMVGMAGCDAQEVQVRLLDLIAPLTAAAEDGEPWQDFELMQRVTTPDNGVRWIQFRARRTGHPSAPGILGFATDMTSRHEHHLALTDIASRYRLLVELSPDAIVVHQAGKVVYVNPATLRYLRAESATQILDRPITDFVHPDSIPAMRHRIELLTTPGATSEPAAAVLLRFDGGTIDVESLSVRTTWEGQPAYQVIMRDVTAQKDAVAAVRYQAALVEHVSDALIATTAAGVVTSWNPAAEAVYGWPAAHALGRPVQDLVGAPLDPAGIINASGVVHAHHRRCDGTPLVVRVSAAQMDDGYVLVCADETARRRAEQHFTTVVAALDEGVIVIAASGLIESVNPAAERILGVRERDVLGRSLAQAVFFDESGARIAASDLLAAHTQRTGQPRSNRIVGIDRPDSGRLWLSLSCQSLAQNGDTQSAVVVSFTDITERRMTDAQLEHQATHDALTGLASRSLLIDRLGPTSRGHRSGLTAVLFVDLDKFKVINDSLGHSVGDAVLRVVGERLRGQVRRGDLVGRLGGDEFAVVAHGLTGQHDAAMLAEHIRNTLSGPVVVDNRNLHIDASIGIVLAGPDDTRVGDDLLRDADLAMYHAKTHGRGRWAFFDVELRERTQRRLQLEQDLRDAPRQDQLWLAYQPIQDLRTGRTTGVEGLLRWTHPHYGAVSPGEFIPLAEDSDLINLLGAHMLRVATDEIAGLRGQHGDLSLAVNLSARQLDDPRLVTDVRTTLAATTLPADALCMEITESALMRDPVAATRTLTALRDLGVRLAIDDFGTGYSSLAQLLTLPVDILKIDQTFVAGLGRSRDAEAIVTSIIAMAHAVDLRVVAEGVETSGQFDALRQLECDLAQGYLLGRPVPVRELEKPAR